MASRVLDEILKTDLPITPDKNILVDSGTRDDAAVYDIGGGRALISTTDFFMPVVDDPVNFGRIAAANAISDVYAMGGRPIMAVSILGWPIKKLSAKAAHQVINGGRLACQEAGIILAGGHSIDSPEPIFGLAVTGLVDIEKLKQNSTATPDCRLYLTKPLGTGILTTAQKKNLLKPGHANSAIDIMTGLNKIGADLAGLTAVKAMTDVTGFGLLGHLHEMCEMSRVNAVVYFEEVPRLPFVDEYLALKCIPGGTGRNFDSYGHHVSPMPDNQKNILCDPQTSGGLLVALEKGGSGAFEAICISHNVKAVLIGKIHDKPQETRIKIN